LIGEWIEGIRGIGNKPFPRSWLALPPLVLNRDQPNNGFLPASDNDLLAPAGLLNQPREFGLGLVDGDGFDEPYVS
jgi:hypothetical protein